MRFWVNICKTELSQSHSKYPTNISYPKYGLSKKLIFLYYKLICRKSDGMINAEGGTNDRTNSIMNVLALQGLGHKMFIFFFLLSSHSSFRQGTGWHEHHRAVKQIMPHTSGQNETFTDLVFQQLTSIHKAKGEMFIKILSVSLF